MLSGRSPSNGALKLPVRRVAVVVEDEPSQRKLLTEHLTRLGLDVIAVSDGHAALSSVRELHPDLLCLDVSLPHISGYEVCEQVRADPGLQNLAVIMTSERASLEERAHSYEAGADGYLSKPHSFDKLAKEVSRLLPKQDDQG
jgi:two-component system phosphate regulon response regulator PhoB